MNLYKLPLIAGAVLMAGCACAADEQSPGDSVGTRAGWELAIQLSDYHYDEPGLDVTIWGPRLGMSAAYTQTSTRNWFVRVDGRVSYGSLKYEGSGTQDGIPDLVFEVRGNVGRDFFGLCQSCVRAVFEGVDVAGVEAVKPFIAGFAADAVKTAEFGNGMRACFAGTDEIKALHGYFLSPGHSESPLLCRL